MNRNATRNLARSTTQPHSSPQPRTLHPTQHQKDMQHEAGLTEMVPLAGAANTASAPSSPSSAAGSNAAAKAETDLPKVSLRPPHTRTHTHSSVTPSWRSLMPPARRSARTHSRSVVITAHSLIASLSLCALAARPISTTWTRSKEHGVICLTSPSPMSTCATRLPRPRPQPAVSPTCSAHRWRHCRDTIRCATWALGLRARSIRCMTAPVWLRLVS